MSESSTSTRNDTLLTIGGLIGVCAIVAIGIYFLIITLEEEIKYSSIPFNCSIIKTDPDRYFPRYDTLEAKKHACENYNKNIRPNEVSRLKNGQIFIFVLLGMAPVVGFASIAGIFSTKLDDVVPVSTPHGEYVSPPCKDNFDEFGGIKSTSCRCDNEI